MEKAELKLIFRNVRYKLITVNNIHYLIDNDINFLSFILPVTQWIIPCKVYRIEDEVKEKLQENTPGNKISSQFSITFGLIGVLISRLISPIILELEIIIPEMFILLPVVALSTGAIYLRVFASQSSKKRVSKIVNLQDSQTERIYFLPKSIKHVIQVIFLPLLFMFLFLGSAFIYFEFRNLIILLLSSLLFLCFLFMNLLPYDIRKEYRVVFSKKVNNTIGK